MRLWNLGKSKSRAQAKYIAADDIHNQETLHLFRALLRQCSYLPDAAARTFFHNYVISRFRKHHPTNIFSPKGRGRRQISLRGQRQVDLQRTARKGLLFLQRANDGHPRHLGRILAMTYGRIGKRRHELLKPLMIPDIPTDQTALETVSNPGLQGLPQPSRQLQALVKSQATKRLSFFSRPVRPTLKPHIPEKNAWGRPMPVRRVRNMRKRWYGATLDSIMPSLPEQDWFRLRDLASGKTRWEGPVQRRGPDKGLGRKHDIVRGTITGGTGFLSSPHRLTPRYMRRLWTKIFAQCPLMKRDESRKSGWDVKWGDIISTKEMALRRGSQDSLAMFEGVDEHGRVLSSV